MTETACLFRSLALFFCFKQKTIIISLTAEVLVDKNLSTSM